MIQAVSAFVVKALRIPTAASSRAWALLRFDATTFDLPFFALLLSLGAQVGVTLTNLITGVLTARFLGSEGRGIFAAVTIWPQLLAMLAVSGLGSAIVFRLRKAPEQAAALTGAALLVGGAGALTATLVGVLVLPFFMTQYSAEVVLLAQLCVSAVALNVLQILMNQACVGLGAFRLFNIALLLPQLLYLAALVVILVFGQLTPTTAVAALLGGALVAFIALLAPFLRLVRPSLRAGWRELRAITSYAGRAMPMDIVCTLYLYADRLVLIPLLAPRELGLYAVAYSFSRLTQLALPAVTSVILSNMSARTVPEAKELHDRAYRFLLPVLMAACALLSLLAEPALALIYGPEFATAAFVFRILLLEGAIGVLAQVSVQFFLAADRPGVVSAIQVSVLAASVAGIIALVHLFGAIGAGIGLLLAAIVRLALLQIAMRVVLKLPAPRLWLNGDDFRYLAALIGKRHA